MATYQRIKPSDRDKEVKGEGRNKKSVDLTIHTHLCGGSAVKEPKQLGTRKS